MNRNKVFLTIAVVLIVGLIYYLESMKAKPTESISKESPVASEQERTGSEIVKKVDKSGFQKAPELTGISGYLNTEPGLKLDDLKGKVILVDFWTYTCINCIRTLPHLKMWDEKYRDKGLVIVGVHTPEFEFEKQYENVEDAVEKYGIKYPIVQDNEYATWRAFKNRFWPHKYLIDSEGFIRYDHIGEGAYEETEEMIQKLLAEMGEDVQGIETGGVEDKTPKTILTPELYLGYEFALPRGQNIGNPEGLQSGKVVNYTLPETLDISTIYLEGKWRSNKDNVEVYSAPGSLSLVFLAKAVNFVGDALSEPVEVEVFIDGKYIPQEQAGKDVQFSNGRAFLVVDQPRLYNVTDGKYGEYTLKLVAKKEGLTINAFTFG